jgi:hypothetical protein
MAAMHGGLITYEPRQDLERGTGSRFSLLLPLEAPTQQSAPGDPPLGEADPDD